MRLTAATGSTPDFRRILRWGRALAINLVLPVVLGWFLTLSWHRYVYRADIRSTVPVHNSFGQVRLTLSLPAIHAGTDEPLIVCGNAGDASLVFIKLLPDGRAKIGIEFWGRNLTEGDEFELPDPGTEVTLTCDLPAFYPAVGSSGWKAVPPDQQKLRRTHYLVTVDGTARLQGATDFTEPPHSPIYLGANPLGGSFVSARFTGRILSHSQGF